MSALSTTEQATIDRFEAAADAPESWEQRVRAVARAMSDEDGTYRFTIAHWRRLAVAALNADAARAAALTATPNHGRNAT